MKKKYEIGFVINPEAAEEEIKKIIDTIVQIIKKAKGSVENVDEWGRRKLGYPIQKHNEGIYIFINVEAEVAIFSEVERRLKLNEKVMRFIVLRTDDKLKKANRLTKKWTRLQKHTQKSSGTDSNSKAVEEEFLTRKEVKNEA